MTTDVRSVVTNGASFSDQLDLEHPVPLRGCGDNDQVLVPVRSNCHFPQEVLGALDALPGTPPWPASLNTAV